MIRKMAFNILAVGAESGCEQVSEQACVCSITPEEIRSTGCNQRPALRSIPLAEG